MKESTRAERAWADYLALGPDRSIEKLYQRYRNGTESVPTKRRNTLKVWSGLYGWQQRLLDIAATAAKEVEERDLAYRRAILEEGYGLAHERVKALKDLAGVLTDELHDPSRRWVSDYKQVGAEVVEIQRFNAAEVEQLRGLLDDIAKEKSERKAVQEITGKDGSPLFGDGLTDDQRTERVARLLDRIRTRTSGPDPIGASSLGTPARTTDGGVAE